MVHCWKKTPVYTNNCGTEKLTMQDKKCLQWSVITNAKRRDNHARGFLTNLNITYARSRFPYSRMRGSYKPRLDRKDWLVRRKGQLIEDTETTLFESVKWRKWQLWIMVWRVLRKIVTFTSIVHSWFDNVTSAANIRCVNVHVGHRSTYVIQNDVHL